MREISGPVKVMKITRNKALFKLLTCLYIVAHSCAIEAFTIPWYHAYFHKHAGAHYKANCVRIDFAQKIRHYALLAYHRITNKRTDLDTALSAIQAQLKEYESWILEQEKEALFAIKQKYGVSDELWHKCLSDIETIKNSYRNGMLHAHPDVKHDPAIPADIRDFLVMLMKQNNINPHSIHLVMADQDEIMEKSETIAKTAFSFITTVENNYLVVDTTYIPSKITLFPGIKDESLEYQLNACAHEIQHVISQHSVTDFILNKYLTYYYSVDTEVFKDTAEYQQLSQIHEAQAEILAAITSAATARFIKTNRQQHCYPDHLYEEHFYHVSTIDMLWKVHDKLEALYFA